MPVTARSSLAQRTKETPRCRSMCRRALLIPLLYIYCAAYGTYGNTDVTKLTETARYLTVAAEALTAAAACHTSAVASMIEKHAAVHFKKNKAVADYTSVRVAQPRSLTEVCTAFEQSHGRTCLFVSYKIFYLSF